MNRDEVLQKLYNLGFRLKTPDATRGAVFDTFYFYRGTEELAVQLPRKGDHAPSSIYGVSYIGTQASFPVDEETYFDLKCLFGFENQIIETVEELQSAGIPFTEEYGQFLTNYRTFLEEHIAELGEEPERY
jgi:hypothetical protein